MSKSLKIGLALGGGGARGAAHIGVLHVFKKYNIPIHTIAGTSAGAIIGAMYAATEDTDWVEKQYRKFLESDVFKSMGTRKIKSSKEKPDSIIGQIGKLVKDKIILNLTVSRSGILDREKLVSTIKYLLPVPTFEELKIPLNVIATDLNSGAEIQYSTGDLIEAVVQSASIPGYVKPYNNNEGQLLMDGGVSSPIPVNSLLDKNLDFVIAVDIARREIGELNNLNLLSIIARSEHIRSIKLTDELIQKADFVISPDVYGAHWSSFTLSDKFIETGKIAAEQKIDELKSKLSERSSWSYKFRRWISVIE